MVHDSITEDIRSIRHALAARFGNEISKIGDDLRRQEASSGRSFVRLPKRQPIIVRVKSESSLATSGQ